jgi:hypothetical protein
MFMALAFKVKDCSHRPGEIDTVEQQSSVSRCVACVDPFVQANVPSYTVASGTVIRNVDEITGLWGRDLFKVLQKNY